MKFYPYKNGGMEKGLAKLKGGGGGTICCQVVLTQEVQVLAILMAGTTSFHPLKGEGQKVLDQRFSHFLASPPCNL